MSESGRKKRPKNQTASLSDKTERQQRGLVPFRPGESGNPLGRPKGSRNKLGEDFLRAMADDFETNGVDVIVKVRETKPEVYIKVVADLLPKDMNLNVNHFDNMTDEQLLRRLSQVAKLAEPLLARMPVQIEHDPGTASSRH